MTEAEFLAHFQGWRQVGPSSYTALSHAEQKTGSIAITRTPDGKWLIHDFSGRSTADILAEVGLSLADLFPTRVQGRNASPAERKQAAELSRLARWKAAWRSIQREAAIIEAAGGMILNDEGLDLADYQRLLTACQRIADARVQLANTDWPAPKPGRFHRDLGMADIEPPILRKEAA
jgi:hypothetical protein